MLTDAEKIEPEIERKMHHARFSAKYVPMLARFQDDWPRDADFPSSLDFGGLQVEPNPEGGVWLSATNGRIAARVLDKDGGADEAFVLTMPDEFVKACTAPAPIRMLDCNHCTVECALPAWTMPRSVEIVYDGKHSLWKGKNTPPAPFCCVIVGGPEQPQEQLEHWGKTDGFAFYTSGHEASYSAHVNDRKIVPMGKTFTFDAPVTVDRVRLNADFLSWLRNIGMVVDLAFYADKRIGVTFPELPEVTAVLMPLSVEAESDDAVGQPTGVPI